MCGIAGYIQLQGEADYSTLKQMTDAIAHRGPDGEGAWISDDRKVALGHRRLSIIDLSECGHQPMHFMDRYVIVFNGEIYNYKEIKQDLVEKGVKFFSETDTEVLVALYHEKGEKCLDELDGMFAFIIYDKETDECFGARDRFGEKPFFYCKTGDGFYFASEMKAIWASGIKKQMDDKMLSNYLLLGQLVNFNDPSQTFYEGIFKLPASHYIKFNTNNINIEVKKYWDIDYRKVNTEQSVEDAKKNINYLLDVSIKRRLRSDVAVGSSLSGGLDSSVIVALIDKIDENKLNERKTFSAHFPGFKKDERKYQDIVINNVNVEAHFVHPTASSMISNLKKIIYHQEEPFSSPSICAQYEVFGLAKDSNVTVLLDGQGADEILAGYHGYLHAFFDELKSKHPDVYRHQWEAYLKLHSSNEINSIQHRSKYGAFKRFVPSIIYNKLKKIKLVKSFNSSFFNSEFISKSIDNLYLKDDNPHNLNEALYQSIFAEGLESLLRFADRNSMAHSREVRLPYLFHELVEYIFTLPSTYKINNGWTKWILRETYDFLLPKEIVWRKDKIGYEPLFDWTDPEFKVLAEKAFSDLKDKNILNSEVTINQVFSKDFNLGWRLFNIAHLI